MADDKDARIAELEAMLDACNPYTKAGETPAQRLKESNKSAAYWKAVAQERLVVVDAIDDKFVELKGALREAKLQLEYLNEKQPRGTTSAVLSRINAALKGA